MDGAPSTDGLPKPLEFGVKLRPTIGTRADGQGYPDPPSEAGVVLPASSSATSGKRSASPLSK
ncbi:hypothetical protein SMICM304S_04465 [Streptomyces microflavus]